MKNTIETALMKYDDTGDESILYECVADYWKTYYKCNEVIKCVLGEKYKASRVMDYIDKVFIEQTGKSLK